MDNREFVSKCLEWQELTEKAMAIGAELEAEVLKRGKTETVGDVRITVSQPRKTYDYEAAAMASELVDQLVIANNTVPKTNWRAICMEVGIMEDVPFTQSGKPSAKIKLR